MAIDVMKETEYQALKDAASKHSTFETFRDEMHKLAESVWHQARGEGNIAAPEDDGDANEDAPEDQKPVAPAEPVQSETQVNRGS